MFNGWQGMLTIEELNRLYRMVKDEQAEQEQEQAEQE